MDIDDEDDVFISFSAGLIDMAFNRKKSDKRKKWLSNVNIRLSPWPSRVNCYHVEATQLAGYIGEHSAYHHGEVSLHGARKLLGNADKKVLF